MCVCMYVFYVVFICMCVLVSNVYMYVLVPVATRSNV